VTDGEATGRGAREKANQHGTLSQVESMTTNPRSRVGFLFLGVFLAACGSKGQAYGDPNSIIAVMPLEQWEQADDAVYAAFERTITTVREEKTFTVTYQEPYGDFWMNLRRFRQMLVVGSRSDPWVQEVLEEGPEDVTEGITQIHDVWAIGQTITLVLLPDGWTLADLEPHLGEVSDLLDNQYRAYARNRMYMSGADTALADTLSIEYGFSLDLPTVYRWRAEDSVLVFRNDNPDPSELIREIVVTWVSPAPAGITAEELLSWRAETVERHYSEAQDVIVEGLVETRFDFGGHPVLQVQGQWRNPPERGWPAGGPFLTRAVTCDTQDRTYLVDAWLYAPGKEKYEYMIQLETILDSFACA